MAASARSTSSGVFRMLGVRRTAEGWRCGTEVAVQPLMRRQNPASLIILSAAALLGFAATTRAVARRQTGEADSEAREGLQSLRTEVVDQGARGAGPIGKEWLHAPVSGVLSLLLWTRGAGGVQACVPLLASCTSELLNRLVEARLHIRAVPPGHPEKGKPSYPSGHAMETTAVALASAYALSRERLISAPAAFAVAVVLSVVSSAGRLFLDRHWLSDAVGGTLLGLSTAAACAAVYESSAT